MQEYLWWDFALGSILYDILSHAGIDHVKGPNKLHQRSPKPVEFRER